MGTRITAKGVDAEAYATEMGVPVRTGILGIFLTNTSIEKIQWNYAPGSAGKGSVFGNPVVTTQYTATDGMAGGDPKYIETNIPETEEFTYFVVGKIDSSAPGWPPVPGDAQPQENRSMFVSDYSGASGNYGVGVYVSRGNAVALALGLKDTTNNYTQQSQHLLVDFSKPLIVSVKYDATERLLTMKNHLTGAVIKAATPDGFSRIGASTGRTMRIGASVSVAYGGKAQIAAAQLHGVALSDTETDKNAAFLRAYAERKGIVFS